MFSFIFCESFTSLSLIMLSTPLFHLPSQSSSSISSRSSSSNDCVIVSPPAIVYTDGRSFLSQHSRSDSLGVGNKNNFYEKRFYLPSQSSSSLSSMISDCSSSFCEVVSPPSSQSRYITTNSNMSSSTYSSSIYSPSPFYVKSIMRNTNM